MVKRHACRPLRLGVIACCGIAGLLHPKAAIYEIGPNRQFSKLGAVPWKSLTAGDVVRIHWSRDPYRERVLVTSSGTASANIQIEGVLGPDGQFPVIDGGDASVPTGLNGLEGGRSVVQIGTGDPEQDRVPRFLQILNLEIRGGRPQSSFLDADGRRRSYRPNAAALYVARGQDIIIRNCRFLDSGNGLFVGSSDRSTSADIRVEGCEFRNNGNPGSIYEHNCYTAAQGITFQGNYFGQLQTGARGNNLKDRSSGLFVACNWIEGGNRELDIVNAEDSILIRRDAAYRITYVINNVLVEPNGDGNRQIVHYGGDNGTVADYRKGVLHFWQNTVVSFRTDGTSLFNLSTDDERLDLRNNIFDAVVPSAPLALLEAAGKVEIRRNWITGGWVESFSKNTQALHRGGLIEVIEGRDPGFLSLEPLTARLKRDSPCIGAAELLPAAPFRRLNAANFHESVRSRMGWSAQDLGAFCRP